MQTTRQKLQQRLATLDSMLGSGILRRGFGGRNAGPNLLNAGWETEARLIRRVLGESGNPADRLIDFRDRTLQFQEKYPDREGWTDQQGIHWEAAMVIEAIDNLLEHIENWNAPEEVLEGEDEDEEADDDELEG